MNRHDAKNKCHLPVCFVVIYVASLSVVVFPLKTMKDEIKLQDEIIKSLYFNIYDSFLQCHLYKTTHFSICRRGGSRERDRGDPYPREREGREREGREREGREREGRERDMREREGRDREGRDREGREREMKEREGREREGRDRGRDHMRDREPDRERHRRDRSRERHRRRSRSRERQVHKPSSHRHEEERYSHWYKPNCGAERRCRYIFIYERLIPCMYKSIN